MHIEEIIDDILEILNSLKMVHMCQKVLSTYISLKDNFLGIFVGLIVGVQAAEFHGGKEVEMGAWT
jgi:hypothetical protein